MEATGLGRRAVTVSAQPPQQEPSMQRLRDPESLAGTSSRRAAHGRMGPAALWADAVMEAQTFSH